MLGHKSYFFTPTYSVAIRGKVVGFGLTE